MTANRERLRYHCQLHQSAAERREETHPLTWRLRDDGAMLGLEEYVNKDGYAAARETVNNQSPNAVIDIMKAANVRGRGGAGFSAGVKWSLTLKGGDMPRGYLVCNADEMEPGTFKDRLLLEQQPHLLIEGMIIAGYANRSKYGYIFLRGEYIEAAGAIARALEEEVGS